MELMKAANVTFIVSRAEESLIAGLNATIQAEILSNVYAIDTWTSKHVECPTRRGAIFVGACFSTASEQCFPWGGGWGGGWGGAPFLLLHSVLCIKVTFII